MPVYWNLFFGFTIPTTLVATILIATSADAGAIATDAVTLNVIVQTQSTATVPAAVLS